MKLFAFVGALVVLVAALLLALPKPKSPIRVLEPISMEEVVLEDATTGFLRNQTGYCVKYPAKFRREPGGTMKLYVKAHLADFLKENWKIWKLECREKIAANKERVLVSLGYYKTPQEMGGSVYQVFVDCYRPNTEQFVAIYLYTDGKLTEDEKKFVKHAVMYRNGLVMEDLGG